MDLVTRSLPFKETQLILPPQESHKKYQMTKFDKMKKFFLIVYCLKEGECFGVGEDHRGTSIITVGQVEIVQVPRKTLLHRKHGLLLSFMRDRVEEAFPSPIDVFRSFQEEVKWKEYKRRTVLQSLQKHNRRLMMPSFNDVPLSIRNVNPDYKEHYGITSFPMI
ncbi:uncharacterized protein LOC110254658 [Exaiptasia diaphana]|uniref:Uncharacterized protein n=1 Tax=Exaiptasia diaphana TaxID=2652724 RepID=A0A913YWV0_EXADI|nr:uncharacterized protein LOC110254658 [Exaiptasia diaphana]